MASITVKQRGSFDKTKRYFERLSNSTQLIDLKKYGAEGVRALASNTPVDTGLTASSWEYEIQKTKNSIMIGWYNTNTHDGYNVALLIQYGHGTKNGGYVSGIDYINPSLKPIFEKMSKEIWAEVTKA